MKKVLILFATKEGQTEKIAFKMEEHLLKLGCEVFTRNVKGLPSDFSLNDFDLLIFGGSMHIGKVEKELAGYLNTHKAEIEAKPNAFFLVLLSAATKDPKLREEMLTDARNRIQKQIHVNFSKIEMVAGALQYSKYSWLVKIIMRTIAKKEGTGTDTHRDYEYTDWNRVKSFTEGLIS